MIVVKDLVKNYGNHQAVKALSLHVEKGQIVGLLGSNGAGKSTTMNIMTGYLCATSGSVEIAGHDILSEPNEAKRQIGYLPEIPPLYLDMTVRSYLKFAAELKQVKKADMVEEIKRVMKITKIEDKATRIIKKLSKGYKQRVGLAAALLGNPPILILDEPTVGLDPNQIIEIRELIKSLGEEHTVILSSHILSEVSAVCDHIIIIDKGVVVAEDTPENLSNNFSNKNHVTAEIKGEKAVVEEVLKGISYVESYEFEKEENGVQYLSMDLNTDENKQDDLFFQFAEKKLPVFKMSHENLSLEDVFLKLTGEIAEQDAQEEDEEAQSEQENIVDEEDHSDASDL